jgi:hypothetical protein
MLAAIRPDSWNYALFLHVLGASVLIGALVTAIALQALGWSRGTPGTAMFARLSFRTLLFIGVPAWFAMRIGAEWIYSKEGWADVPDEPGWLGVGYITADLGGLLLLISVILAGLGLTTARARGGANEPRGARRGDRAVVLAVYLVALWAMTAKPG